MNYARMHSLLARVMLCLVMLSLPLGCTSSPPVRPLPGDRSLDEATVAAHAAFRQDRIEEAATFYTLALKRARALDHPSAIGDSAYNLGACMLRLHQYDRARALLTEAGYELARSNSPLADVLLLQARTARLAGNGPEAEAFIRHLRTDPLSDPSETHLGQAVLLEGQLACDSNEWENAEDQLARARIVLGPDCGILLQAQLAALTGRIAMGTQNPQRAAEAFDRQVDLLRSAHQYRALIAALGQAGEAHAVLNHHSLAADRFYRAARSAAAWGDTVSVRKWALSARSAAQQGGDEVIVLLAESLLSDYGVDYPKKKDP